MERLEQIVADLESGKLSLDDSIKVFEGGRIVEKMFAKLNELS
jgi:exodeoxyribonuclease VII small subunit